MIAVFGTIYLIIIQRDMADNRNKQGRIASKFEPYTKTIIEKSVDSWKDWLFVAPFIILVWIGVFVVWLILQK